MSTITQGAGTSAIPAQRTHQEGVTSPSAAAPSARQPHGYSRPDCADCQELRKHLVASYDTPDEGVRWTAWTDHMYSVHPGWRKGPTFPQTVF